ncbi:hypothetical protein [Arenicella xantha]|uniref:Lipocalin-like protein n=1 Tax=Arenicella xantha TaxID=644221 RepID=A0A395JMU5_9GAMM|nr:hypothetical protein [Arenicella xantha]RBP51765.1 hypothetical protein DFR28_1021198 [Arenicella xantha]
MSRALLFVFFVASLVGCTTLNFESPNTVDLSGVWLLDPSISQHVLFAPPKSNRKSSRREGGAGSSGGRGEHGGQGRRGGRDDSQSEGNNTGGHQQKPEAAVANKMTIEQAFDSMGIRYVSGPNQTESYRDIDWGTTETYKNKTTAGWRETSLVVETESKRTTTTETYNLSADGNVLTLEFEVDDRKFLRVFKRDTTEAAK